jgi:hypothetical protein
VSIRRNTVASSDDRSKVPMKAAPAAMGEKGSRLAGGLGTPRIAGEAVCRVPTTAPPASNSL